VDSVKVPADRLRYLERVSEDERVRITRLWPEVYAGYVPPGSSVSRGRASGAGVEVQ
jgi:hypothetical protein